MMNKEFDAYISHHMKTWAEKIKPPEEGLALLLNSAITVQESCQPNPSDLHTDKAMIINANERGDRVGLVQNQRSGTQPSTFERIESR